MIYRNIYFKGGHHIKIVFEKNAEFNVLATLWILIEFVGFKVEE